ncbi:ubiquitin carboxyl-terminal hydrolase 38 [Rhizophagus clarus]|uniref:Ubiquitin carboxyl-terminal hydrolase n=1 Tax=Rhizophagus clarus TaxID=94130 RepID=A0A8H3R647_9GLOM|nr:ubiquitin carboxyl-terminal hydrolase 38 [Rhizophagus clarus]
MEKILDTLLDSKHEKDVKIKFIVTYLNNLNKSKETDWEQLCEYARALISKNPSRDHVLGELILSRIAHLQTSIYMHYFNSEWIGQTLSNANNVPSYLQLKALIKIIKYKQVVANDSDDVKNDCQLLQSYANKYVAVVKGRIDWLRLFVSMFNDIPQSIPEDHGSLIEILVYALAIPENDSLESYNEFVKQTVNLIVSLWEKGNENIGITIREVFIRLSSNQTCSKSIVLLISKIPKKCTTIILPYVQRTPPNDINKFEVCIERMILTIPHQFADNIGCWIIELIKALEKLQDKAILIRIARTNTQRCFEYLLDRNARNDALMVGKYLLLGAPDVFDLIIPTFSKGLEKIAQEGDRDILLELSKIAQCTMHQFPSGGYRYSQLSKTLKSLNLPVLKQAEISEIRRKSIWIKETNIAGGRKETMTKTPNYFSQTTKKKGLQNLGNTCFLNSVLQALFNSMEFRNRTLQAEISETKTPTIYQLQICFARMMLSSKPYLSPSALLKTLPEWLNDGRQQDCHEFLKILFSRIEEESENFKKSKSEEISTTCGDTTDIPICPFGGKLENTIKCLTCGNKSKTEEEFHDLSLSLKVDSYNLSFSDLLSEFLSDENLKGDNQYYCDECEGLRDALKLTRIIIPPRYLILSLNRFEYNVEYGRRIKIMTHVPIQDSLSVIQVYDNDESINGQVNSKVNGIINGNVNEVQYDLSAIVIHSGSSAEYGHYYTYAKDEEDGKWYNYNDSYVNTSSLSRIISEGKDFKSDTPYLLFFQQKNIINRKLSEISSALKEEVEKEDDAFGKNDFSTDVMNKKNDKDEDPLSGYDIFDYDKSVF